jgi:hypothetical protein
LSSARSCDYDAIVKEKIVHRETHWLLAILSVTACSPDCPPGSSQQADGLCHLDDSETGTAGDTSGGDTGEPPSWGPLPEGCGLSSGGDDPLTLKGSEFLQDQYFVELTDIELSTSGDHAYAVGQGGLTIMDISDPTTPSVLYSGRGTNGTEMRFDHIEVGEDDTLYATGSFGMSVFDASTPAAPEQLRRIDGSGMSGMAQLGSSLYLTTSAGELVVYDVTDPQNPKETSRVSGLSHPWRPAVQGTHIYVSDNTAGVVVYDASTPSSPSLLGAFEATGGVQEIAFSPDGGTLYAAVGGAGVEVFSLEDPAAPVSLGTISVNYSVISVDTAGGLLWAANQQDVVAFDISQPREPSLVNTEQTEQWAMHIAARDNRVVVADWAYLHIYEADPSIIAPDMAPSSTKVYLPEGGSVSLSVSNLGGGPLSLLGGEAPGVLVESDRTTIGSGRQASIRLSFTGAAADTVACLSSDDPDEPDHYIEIVATEPGGPGAGVGSAAPDFTLEDLDGQSLTLSDQRGKPVVLAYFATW